MKTESYLRQELASTQACLLRNVARRTAANQLGFHRQAAVAQKMVEACSLDLLDIARELGEETPL